MTWWERADLLQADAEAIEEICCRRANALGGHVDPQTAARAALGLESHRRREACHLGS